MPLSSFAINYGMHPFRVSRWLSSITQARTGYGEKARLELLHDGNPEAEAALNAHFEQYGLHVPPSIDILMEEAGMLTLRNLE